MARRGILVFLVYKQIQISVLLFRNINLPPRQEGTLRVSALIFVEELRLSKLQTDFLYNFFLKLHKLCKWSTLYFMKKQLPSNIYTQLSLVCASSREVFVAFINSFLPVFIIVP